MGFNIIVIVPLLPFCCGFLSLDGGGIFLVGSRILLSMVVQQIAKHSTGKVYSDFLLICRFYVSSNLSVLPRGIQFGDIQLIAVLYILFLLDQ